MMNRCVLETLEGRQLLSVNIPLLNSDFESPTWVKSGNSWVQQAVVPGTQALNYNETDPRFGPPGYGKTAEGGGGPGPNGEGLYNEHNDLGANQYFNYVNGQLPAPANGTNFFCLIPAWGGTYHVWVDQQPDTTGDTGNHGDLNYPPMIPATTAHVGHTYQLTVALGNPLVNTSNPAFPNIEVDLTIGAATYNMPSHTDSRTTPAQAGDTWLYYDGGGTYVATAQTIDPNWVTPGNFRDISLTWTCPPEADGKPLGIMFVFAGMTKTVAMDNIRLVDITTPPAVPTAVVAAGASMSQINLTWTDNSNNESGFKIDQSTSPDFSTGVTTATVGANVNYYAATGLSANSTYYYRVRATNDAGDSASTATASATTGVAGTPVAIPVPDGNFASDSPGYYVNSNSGGGTFTLPMTGTLSGWTITATPSTANSGSYAWAPAAAVDSVTSSGTSPWSVNAPGLGNQPASSYNAFVYYPGEQYNWNNVVGGTQAGASVRLTTTGINAAAVAGATYTATIQYANVSWSNCANNPSANVALNILANGVVVSSSYMSGLAQGSPWTRVTSGWVCPPAYAGQAIQIQVVATNFLEGPGSTQQWQVPSIGFANTTLTVTTPAGLPAAPSGLSATAASASQINLSWTDNSNNETGFKIDQATSSDFSMGLTTVTVGANVTTYSATGLSSGTTCYFRVRATNAIGDSANTSTASATIAVPGTALTITNPTFDDGGWLTGDGDDRNAEHQNFPYPALSQDGWWGSTTNIGGVLPWWGRWNPTNAQFPGTTDVMNFPNITRGPLPAPAAGTQYAFVTPLTDGGTGPLATVWQVNTERFCVKNPDGSTATVTAGQHYVASMAVGRPLDTGSPDYTLQLVTEDTTTGNILQVLSSTMVTQANITPGTFYDLTTSYDAPASGGPIGGMLALNIICSDFYETNGVGTVGVFSNARLTVGAPVLTPAAPSGLTATTASASQINLNWTDNSSNETGFKIDQATSSDFSTGLTTVTVAADVTTYNATGLASGVTYYYRVRATNANGDSANSSPASATTQGVIPAAASGLTATAASASQINLGWTDNSNNETGFKIDQATSSDFSTGLTTVTVGANVAIYSATGLSSNTTYYYRVRATNGIGDSASTSPASATTQATVPAAPSGLTATAASSSQINLGWTDNSSNETGFKIDQATSSDFSTGLITVAVGANVTTYSATGLSASTTYYYRVRATNAIGDSANTSPASATTSVPGTPVAIPIPDADFTDPAGNCINSNTGGGLTFTSPMTATLSGWAISANPSTANGGLYMSGGWEPYGVLDSVTSGSGASPYNCNVAWVGNQPASSYHAFIYYPGEQYNWNNVVGGAQPGASLTMTTTGISAAAVAGTTYTATIQYANVSWSNVNVNPSANVALNILANGTIVGTGTLAGLAQGSPWTTVTATWTAAGAYAGQAIQLQVVATNFLEGPGSTQQWQVPGFGFTHATLTATTASAAPAAPSGLTATATSASQINLSWTDNSSNETGFKIDQATSSDFSAGLTTVTVGANVTTYSATGLSSNTTYYFRVRATNTVGDSASTVPASATTAGTTVIPVQNGSFENSTPGSVLAGLNSGSGGTISDPSSGPNTIAGWNVVMHPYTGAYAPGGWGSVAYTNYGLWSATDQTGGPWWYGASQDGKKFMLLTSGEPYANGAVPNNAVIPGLSFVLTSTGISANAVAGVTYAASAFAQNLNKMNWAGGGVPFSPKGADMTMNILAGGVVVASQTLDAASFTSTDAGTNWVPFGASWTAGPGDAGKAIQIQIVASNFWDGQQGAGNQWTAAPMGIDNATLTSTTPNSTPAMPVVSTPSAAAYVNAGNYTIGGSADADSLVRIYSDLNNNGVIDGADAIVASQQLSGGATAYSISVPLTQDAANNFLVCATNAAGNSSAPADVPTITVPASVTLTWNGSTGDWTDGSKWSAGPNFPDNGNGGLTYSVIINSGTVTLSQSITIQSLTLGDGATLRIAGTTGSVLTVSSLTLTGSGQLDLGNNTLVVNYGGGVSPIGNIINSLKSGRNGGMWDGSGINSGIAAVNGSYGVGVVDDAASQQVKAMCTLLGDTNLDGKVDVGDLGTLLNNYGQAGKIWSDGEFAYNASGAVDVGDLGLLLNNYGQAGSVLAGTTSEVVSGDGPATGDETATTQLVVPGNDAIAVEPSDPSQLGNSSGTNAVTTLTFTGASETPARLAPAAISDGAALRATQLPDALARDPGAVDVVTVGGGGNDALYGDYAGNGTVNNADYFQFKMTFGLGSTDSGFLSLFDDDGNGTVNDADYFQFKKRFGAVLTY